MAPPPAPSAIAHHPAPSTPLMRAAQEGDLDACKSLVAQGEKPDLTNEHGFDALIWACVMGHKDIVAYLVDEAGCKANVPPGKHTPLRGAGNYGHTEIVRFLLDRGADPSVPSAGGRTPLMGAAMNGRADIVAMLLEAGADKSAKNDGGESALDLAVAKGHDAVCKMLE